MPNVPKRRRRGGENSEKRTLLIDAAERLILQEGYGAVTTRRLASEAGLKSQLVHYYFETVDDVFVAVIRRRATRNLERMVEMVRLDGSFEREWKANRNAEELGFWRELVALANHRKSIRGEVRHYTAQKRLLQSASLERSYQVSGMQSKVPSIAWILLIVGASHVLAMESMLGLSYGHQETMDLLQDIIRSGGMVLQPAKDAPESNSRSTSPPKHRTITSAKANDKEDEASIDLRQRCTEAPVKAIAPQTLGAHRGASVDAHDLTGDERSLVRYEQCTKPSDVFGQS